MLQGSRRSNNTYKARYKKDLCNIKNKCSRLFHNLKDSID